jgi:hypothetical protein
MLKWIEISADFECSNRCEGCFSVSEDGSGPRMDTREVLETLRHGRAQGARWLWLGGGEPTLRKDLFAVAAAARKLGYTRVKLQTNGMLLAYPEFTRRCVEAGVTEVNFAIKGATAATHDAMTRTPGCFDLLVRGIDEWRKHGLPMDGDILVYASGVAKLLETVRFFSGKGVQRFNLWLFSASVRGPGGLSAQVPRIRDVMPGIAAILAEKLSARGDFITSLHTPPCTVPVEASACLFDSKDLDLLVANPGGYRFRLEKSPIEGGVYLDRCAGCAMRARCGGLRRDYLAIHGDAEFQPVTDGIVRPLPVLRDVVGE